MLMAAVAVLMTACNTATDMEQQVDELYDRMLTILYMLLSRCRTSPVLGQMPTFMQNMSSLMRKLHLSSQ